MDSKQLAMTMYVGDMAVEEIAEELEVSVPTVYRWLELKDIGAQIREQKYNEAVRMYAETDIPVSVICSQLNISPPTLYRCTCARGIPSRQSKNKMDEETEQDIIELYQADTPIKDICSIHSIAPPVLYNLLRKHNIEPCRRKASHAQHAQHPQQALPIIPTIKIIELRPLPVVNHVLTDYDESTEL